MEEIIYFELDNWFGGRDYPNAEPFIGWMGKDYGFCFGNDEWCKENKLCVEAGPIDMSTCFCISAPRSWVEENCPKLLTDEECGSYTNIEYTNENGERVREKRYESCKYSKFVCKPDEDGDVRGRVSHWPFRDYEEANFGVHWNNWWWEDISIDDDDDDDEEEEE